MKNKLHDKENREQLLSAYLNGDLSAQEVQELWSYLIQDSVLYEEMVHLANLKKVLLNDAEQKRIMQASKKRIGLGYELRQHTQKRIWKGVAAILGAVALLISLYWGILRERGYNDLAMDLSPKKQLDTKVYRGELGQTAHPVLLEVQAFIAADEYELAIERINEVLISETAQGELSLSARIELEIEIGMYTYNMGDIDQALALFLEVEEELSQLEVDSQLTDQPSLTRLYEKRDHLYWVIAQSYYATDQYSSAILYFEKIVALDGSYSRAAATFIRSLKGK